MKGREDSNIITIVHPGIAVIAKHYVFCKFKGYSWLQGGGAYAQHILWQTHSQHTGVGQRLRTLKLVLPAFGG